MIDAYDPIDFMVSSYGGSAAEMFGVYDTIRRNEKEVRGQNDWTRQGDVCGSAYFWPAERKGRRKIGANCRVMIHGVISGQHGHLHDVENEFEEAKQTQAAYIKGASCELKHEAVIH